MKAPTRSPSEVQTRYRALLEGVADSNRDDEKSVTFLTSSISIESGRGDLYVALGLGAALESRGWQVQFVARSHWYTSPLTGKIVVGMMPEFDVRTLSRDQRAIAWVRNNTRHWAKSPWMQDYDAYAASSTMSAQFLSSKLDVEVGVLPLGVDTHLFRGDRRSTRQRTVVTTANHWGTDRDIHRALRDLKSPSVVHWYGEDRSQDARLRKLNRGAVSYFDLPKKYAQSILVLDDVHNNNKEFGNLNSRIFEALASGALPVTNTRLGLAELGLEDLPVYRNSGELSTVITELLSESASVERRASILREKVIADHSFDTRAAQFEDLLGSIRSARDLSRDAHTRIHFFPDYRPTNPYQSMLYSESKSFEVACGPVDVGTQVSSRDSGGDAAGEILHLHWTTPIVQKHRDPLDARRELDLFKERVTSFKERGGKVVWTVHNVMPHEYTHYLLELELSQFLADSADAVHVMTPQSIAETEPFYTLDPSKVAVVPHAGYDGQYLDVIGRDAARESFGLKADEIAILAVGGIRPYKGMETLLSTFEKLSETDPRLVLLLAGRPGGIRNVHDFAARLKSTGRVKFSLEFVEDHDLQRWYRAADIAVLPYLKVLNSGSVQLARTFALPYCAPRLGSLKDLSSDPGAFLYDPASPGGLMDALVRLIADNDRRARGSESARLARNFGAREMSNEFFESLVHLGVCPAPSGRLSSQSTGA